MHKLLADIIEKEGIKDFTSEERETFDRWNQTLAKNGLSKTEIAEFCSFQQSLIERTWADRKRDRTNDPYLADIHAVYGEIKRAIESPKREKEQLAQVLKNRLDNEIP